MSQQLKFQGEEESNFATREPAKPLKDAQMCGSFFYNIWHKNSIISYKNQKKRLVLSRISETFRIFAVK